MSATNSSTLKLEKSEFILPGLALPEAFRALDTRLESTLQLCSSSKGPMDGPFLGLVTVCQEMQTLLKLAFIENGMLAGRIELLTRYQAETVKSTDKKVAQVELSHKVTKKQIKGLRKKLSVYETIQRKKTQNWWDVKVHSSDYETFSSLSRGSGSPDLEFMLRINQILMDFVKDLDRQELILPPMSLEERAELSKLASTYKLRCRYGKSTQLATSTLIKARQTTIPNPGEVDAVLDTFARTHRKTEGDHKELVIETQEVITKDIEPSPLQPIAPPKQKPPTPRIEIPSTMLTPLSSLTSPTIDIGISLGPSPPNSGMSTPTFEPAPSQKVGTDPQRKPKDIQEPILKKAEPVKPIILRDPRLSNTSSAKQGPLNSQSVSYPPQLVAGGRVMTPPTASITGPAVLGKPLLTGSSGLLLHQMVQGQLKQPTVVAAPIKVTAVEGKRSDGEPPKQDKDLGASPPKRIRLTRKSAGGTAEQD